jgi:hypothetical protein
MTANDRAILVQRDEGFTDIAYLSEPLEKRVGYELDENLVGGWAEALAQLADDADYELPLFA